jgi:signal transduction histidine kinase
MTTAALSPLAINNVNPAQKPPLRFWQRLRWNLIFYFVLLALLPLVIVVYITLSQITAQSARQVFGQLESVSELKADQISQWLDGAKQITQTIIASNTGQVMIDALSSPDDTLRSGLSTSLKSLIDDSRTRIIDRYFLYDMDGRVIAASKIDDLGKIVQRQPYFAASLTNSHTQPPYYAVNTGELTIIHTEPIYRGDRIVGVLAGQLNVETLSQIMSGRVGLGETGETYLVSSENNYLLTPSRFPDTPQSRAYRSFGIDNALQGKSGSGVYTDYHGEMAFGYYRWIPELQAGLLAEQDESEALAATRTVLNSSLIVAIVAVLVAIVIGFNRISRISRPLRALTITATHISNGNLSLRSQIKQRNEIGLLADAFNQMTGQLQQNIEKLDHQLVEIDRTNRQLQIASAQAREAARLKSEFMATMSHELRTPLNAMIGFTGILLSGMDGEMDKSAHYMVERVEANSKRLLGLINDVLDISKIEAGRMDVVEKPVVLRQMVEQWHSQNSVLAREKSLTFDVSVDPALPPSVLLDRERVTQVIVNLISNAIKFTEKGGVRLEVTREADNLLFKVTDTGIGIPPHALNYIFDEFRQVDGSWRRNYGGTGLGLAIVRNLCRIMNGKVSVESKLGEGSTFIIQLPLKEVQAAPQAA